MKRAEILLIVSAFVAVACPAGEKTRLDAAVYGGAVDYKHSDIKDDAHVSGIYLYLGHGLNHLLEMEVDRLTIDYSNADVVRQWDLTTVYSHFGLWPWRLRLGAHAISGDDDVTDGAWTAFLGAHYQHEQTWGAGIDGYLTTYDQYPPSFLAQQVTVHAGMTLWRGWDHRVQGEVRGHWIHLDNDVGLGQKTFLSVEEHLTLLAGAWSLSGFMWQGEQAFAVRGDGFVVYSVAEEHTGVFGIALSRSLGRRDTLELRVSRETFRHLGLSSTVHADSISLLFRHTF